MAYILIVALIVVLVVCSIPMRGLGFPDGTTYAVIRIEHGKLGRRCMLENLVDKSTFLCEWNQFKSAHVGDILVVIDGKLEELR